MLQHLCTYAGVLALVDSENAWTGENVKWHFLRYMICIKANSHNAAACISSSVLKYPSQWLISIGR